MASTFLPTNIADCVLHLRADLGVTTVSGGVSLWEDQSSQGNDLSQATAGNRPTVVTLGGQAALQFAAASSQYLHGAFTGIAAGAEAAVYLVCKLDTLGGAGVLRCPLDIADANGTNNGFLFLYQNDAADGFGAQCMKWRAANGAASDCGYAAFTDVTNPTIWTGLHSVANRNILQNGTHRDTTEASKSTPAITQCRVGRLITGVAGLWDGDIAEVIVYARVPSIPEHRALAGYLGTRYGVTVA